MDKSYKFDAFISYLQKPDRQMAIAVRNSLMRLGARKYLLHFRSLEIFRDESSLAGQGGLTERICRGMDNSRFFILFARPEIIYTDTPEKRNWVEKELEYWLSSVVPRE